jgi:agmatine/peptidylarginine deiminase
MKNGFKKYLFGLSLLFTTYACTSPNSSTVPANNNSSLVIRKYNDTNPSVFARSGIINNNGSYSYISDCAAGFKVSGNIEGEPCESDTFSGMDKFYIPPEYNKDKAVIVSEYISQVPGGSNILNGILEAGSDVWYLNGNTQESAYSKNSITSKSPNKIIGLDIVPDTIWARDWSPLMSIPQADYNGENVDLKMLDINYYIDRSLDDSVSRQLRDKLSNNVENLSLKRNSLPVYMEGGNILCNETDCFLTNKLLSDNQRILQANDIALDEAEIKKEFKKQVSQNIWLVPMIPYEPTKHIDMWAKFLKNDTLLIASLSDETINAATPESQAKIKEVRDFLEVQASGNDKSGRVVINSLAYLVRKQNPSIKIIRVPMPAPVFHSSENMEDGIQVFRSYTNSLLVNGYALVPQYSRDIYSQLPYTDNSLKQKYEEQIQAVYQQAGYKVIWIPSDNFIGMGGAVHCVTMQVPSHP